MTDVLDSAEEPIDVWRRRHPKESRRRCGGTLARSAVLSVSFSTRTEIMTRSDSFNSTFWTKAVSRKCSAGTTSGVVELDVVNHRVVAVRPAYEIEKTF